MKFSNNLIGEIMKRCAIVILSIIFSGCSDYNLSVVPEKIEPGIECRHSTAGHTPSCVNEIRNPLRPSPGRLYPRRISCAQSALRNEVCVPSRCAAYRADSRGDQFKKIVGSTHHDRSLRSPSQGSRRLPSRGRISWRGA